MLMQFFGSYIVVFAQLVFCATKITGIQGAPVLVIVNSGEMQGDSSLIVDSDEPIIPANISKSDSDDDDIYVETDGVKLPTFAEATSLSGGYQAGYGMLSAENVVATVARETEAYANATGIVTASGQGDINVFIKQELTVVA